MKVFRVSRAMIVLLACVQFVNAQYQTELHVALDGSGEYTSIQAALDDTKSFPDQPITVYVKAGVYKEKVTIHQWNPHVTLKGEGADKTIIQWDDAFDRIGRGRNSTFMTATLSIEAEDVRVEDLTIENTAGPVGQAIALSVTGDRCQFHRCRILGDQDTLFADGTHARQYFADCYIAGTTDFIFGGATVFFERCEIRSKSNSFITAASTPKGRKYGFVFQHCQLTADPGVDAVYLGRPWRDHAKTALINCAMGPHIRPEGWDNWSSPEREHTTEYVEFHNTGPGADVSGRVGWCHLLGKDDAIRYSRDIVLEEMRITNEK